MRPISFKKEDPATSVFGSANADAPSIGVGDPFGSDAEDEGGFSLAHIAEKDVPPEHPVGRFAAIYREHYLGHSQGVHLPHENDLFQSEEAFPLFTWAKHIEPIELDGGVDFKVLRQGERNALRERRTYRDQWMSDTVDPEFVQALYREIIAAAVLRKPLYSKGRTPTRERSFLYCLRGVFPVYAENQARLRLFQLEAEPYVIV